MTSAAGAIINQEYRLRNAQHAERSIKAALHELSLPIRGSYTLTEVRSLLGIGEATSWRLINKFELDEHGRLVRPDCLRTFILGRERRVLFLELVEFINRNSEYSRNTSQGKPDAE